MSLRPDWRSFPGGSMKRAALWLATEVGESGVFTKEELRRAFPGVGQIDRRVRDLRDDGWVIHTSLEDVSLDHDEQRLVRIGGPVWDANYKRPVSKTLTNKGRQDILAADDYACVLCGISGGEPYPDDPLRRAKLAIGRLEVRSGRSELRTLCDRCLHGSPRPVKPESVRSAIDALEPEQRARLVVWLRADRRALSAEEAAWGAYRRLSADSRSEIRNELLA